MPASSPIEERFWSKVALTANPDKCWLWMGRKNGGGYGQFDPVRKKPTSAHRVSWELVNGPVGIGLDVCHRCDVRSCVNPGHLFVGTRSDNIKDAFSKGRIRRDGVFNPHHTDYTKPVSEYPKPPFKGK